MKLNEYLLKERMNPSEFACKCGISVTTIYRILKGKKSYLNTARKIERNTKKLVTVEELLGDVSE